MLQTFTAVIARWDTQTLLADDVGATPGMVRQWRYRDNIPPEYWLRVAAAAKRRKFYGISLNSLAEIAARRLTF